MQPSVVQNVQYEAADRAPSSLVMQQYTKPIVQTAMPEPYQALPPQPPPPQYYPPMQPHPMPLQQVEEYSGMLGSPPIVSPVAPALAPMRRPPPPIFTAEPEAPPPPMESPKITLVESNPLIMAAPPTESPKFSPAVQPVFGAAPAGVAPPPMVSPKIQGTPVSLPQYNQGPPPSIAPQFSPPPAPAPIMSPMGYQSGAPVAYQPAIPPPPMVSPTNMPTNSGPGGFLAQPPQYMMATGPGMMAFEPVHTQAPPYSPMYGNYPLPPPL